MSPKVIEFSPNPWGINFRFRQIGETKTREAELDARDLVFSRLSRVIPAVAYRGTSHIRKRLPLGPYSRPMPRGQNLNLKDLKA